MNARAAPSGAVARVLDRLRNVKSGANGWTARCPCHDDKRNSVTISEGNDGRVLLKCFAGCQTDAVVQALGLQMRDLFPHDEPNAAGHSPRRLTLAELAADKRLPLDFLQALGLREFPVGYRCKGGVGIPYRDASGQEVRRKRRTHLVAKKGSYWPKGVPLMAYGIDRLEDARRHGYLALVEGESDAWTCWYHEFPALGIPGATAKKTVEAEHLQEIDRVYVIREPDNAGSNFAAGIAGRLKELGWRGRAFVVGMHDAKDLNELHQRDPESFKAVFQKMLDGAAPLDTVTPTSEAEGAPHSGAPSDRQPPQRDRLVALAADAQLWHDGDGTGYATIVVASHRENHRIRSRPFRDWLGHRYFQQFAGAPSNQAMQDALNTIEARARFDSPKHEPALRLAEHEDAIYLDLADGAWRAVQVTAEGWRVVSDPPVKFIRPRNMRPLPVPERDGKIADLRHFVNVSGEDDFKLIVGFLLAALRPGRPFTILILNGEQGAAKSTTARVLRRLVDPNAAEIRSVPREDRDLAAAARNSWIVCYDNLSSIAPWLADSLCRLATGGGLGGRELYTDHDEAVFDAMRPVILNGIPDLATRPDLADRAIVLNLPQISDDQRKPETEFWAEFDAASGRLLGALLDAVSVALKRLSEVHLDRLPRMADFATWVTAAEPGCGWPEGSFMAAYAGNRESAVELAVEADPVALAVRDMIADAGQWEGTATELLHELNGRVSGDVRPSKGWPADGARLSNRLRRAAPALRTLGVKVIEPRRQGRASRKVWKIRKEPQDSDRSDRSDRSADIQEFSAGAYSKGSDRTSDRPNPLKNNQSDAAGAAGADSKPTSKWEVVI